MMRPASKIPPFRNHGTQQPKKGQLTMETKRIEELLEQQLQAQKLIVEILRRIESDCASIAINTG